MGALLLLSRIQDFQNDSFNIDSDETSYEILRRSKTETYYLESVKVFNKAFTIDRVEEILFKCHQRRQVSKWNNNFCKGNRVRAGQTTIPFQCERLGVDGSIGRLQKFENDRKRHLRKVFLVEQMTGKKKVLEILSTFEFEENQIQGDYISKIRDTIKGKEGGLALKFCALVVKEAETVGKDQAFP